MVLQGFLDDVAAGRAIVPLARTFDLDSIVEAHTVMEHASAAGKLVVDAHRVATMVGAQWPVLAATCGRAGRTSTRRRRARRD